MDIQQMYPEDLEKVMSQKNETDYLLVDVRQPGEYETTHIPGAKLLPLSELEGRLNELDEDRELIFYCRSGRRSNIGAVLTRDSGLVNASIFNLVGGISAWEGKALEEFPIFEVFQGVDDFSRVLEQAMNMEKGTYLLYRDMVELSSGLPIETTFEKLSRMETAHAKAIYRFLQKTKQVKPFEEFFEELSGHIVEGGWEAETALHQLRDHGENTCLFLSELALELEYRAYDLYRSMAEGTSDTEQQKALFFLSEQEKAHVTYISHFEKNIFLQSERKFIISTKYI